jgi:protein-tyrosine-phosphatase
MSEIKLFPDIEKYVSSFDKHYSCLPEGRKNILQKVADFVSYQIRSRQTAKIIFICTHNSRRSHMSQIWAQAATFYFGIPDVRLYSGGTEVSAFHPNAIHVMTGAGFRLTSDGSRKNPVYQVRYAADQPAISVFSKRFDHELNPQENFCAVMTCTDADKNCPYIPGAIHRIPIIYEDPKKYDLTEKESQAYAERCFQIGLEMFYVFGQIGTH